MTEDLYRSQFRLPYPLYEKLKAAAESNRRSVNAELVARLEESLAIQGMDSAPRSFVGVNKQILLAGSEALDGDKPVTRAELWEVIGQAIAHALHGQSEIPPDNAKPRTNTGPKPRKRYPKD
ncbi:Arc family DNA-binding protein [Pseudomonas guariconensis]|uniref:Arc family DNA-binding protein n=1 Tax=Pseudomonas guariconensis TaxID=1288410 RepID=UPI002D1F8725|nr:Arc family DNA-binding protein [Pseudomonas guariconensis]MEB3843538.1 Arc family DNA-binding protein [Pseudomonas guariconensis]MEB3876406.1 Arc family DNA-binding protein [Pseudomonas guariconensis]MEB3881537.1 Arc family DNA-binding protein [Pseudomonas guariconensis]MEB3898160.1 Arc family DNA-binding protein [Pseudomonas guariconensis]